MSSLLTYMVNHCVLEAGSLFHRKHPSIHELQYIWSLHSYNVPIFTLPSDEGKVPVTAPVTQCLLQKELHVSQMSVGL